MIWGREMPTTLHLLRHLPTFAPRVVLGRFASSVVQLTCSCCDHFSGIGDNRVHAKTTAAPQENIGIDGGGHWPAPRPEMESSAERPPKA